MEVRMFIRAFDQLLWLQSDATPEIVDWVIDWRWLAAPEEEAAFPSERSLIDWPTWEKPKTPRHA
jgi:hypothetical protein